MQRLFGKSKEAAPVASLEDTTGRIQQRGDTLDNRIKQLDVKMAEFKKQLKAARTPAQQNLIKQRASQVLKQKKMYEGQRDQLYEQQMTVESVAFNAENMKDTIDTVKTLQQTSQYMKKEFKTNKNQLDINKIDGLMDELYDMQDMQQEIQEAIGQSYMTPEVDDDDLMAELDALDEDLTMDALGEEGEIPSYLQEPELPEAPIEPIAQDGEPQALRS